MKILPPSPYTHRKCLLCPSCENYSFLWNYNTAASHISCRTPKLWGYIPDYKKHTHKFQSSQFYLAGSFAWQKTEHLSVLIWQRCSYHPSSLETNGPSANTKGKDSTFWLPKKHPHVVQFCPGRWGDDCCCLYADPSSTSRWKLKNVDRRLCVLTKRQTSVSKQTSFLTFLLD